MPIQVRKNEICYKKIIFCIVLWGLMQAFILPVQSVNASSLFSNIEGTYNFQLYLLQITGAIDAAKVGPVTVVLDEEEILIQKWNAGGTFSWDRTGINPGTQLALRAYDFNGNLLETLNCTLNTAGEFSVDSQSVTVNLEALIAAINDARNRYDQAVEGTSPGQYQPGARDTLLAAIEQAEAVRDNPDVTQEEVDEGLVALNSAVLAFESQKVSVYLSNIEADYSAHLQLLSISGQINPEQVGEVKIDWNGEESAVIWGTNGSFTWSRSGIKSGDLIKVKAYNFAGTAVLETRSFVLNSSGELVDAAANIDECFIATACFGSKFEPSVILLRHFRDDYLLSNSWGAAFVKAYYRLSPPVADFIAGSALLRTLVRVLLLPLIGIVYLFYYPVYLSVLVLFGMGLLLYRRKRAAHMQN